MSNEFPKPSGDCITDRMRQNRTQPKAGERTQAHTPLRYDKASVIGSYGKELSPIPWTFKDHRDFISPGGWQGGLSIRDSQNHCIAIVGTVDAATIGHAMTNARLIAAAPETKAQRDELKLALQHAEWKLRDVADWIKPLVSTSQVESVLAHADEARAAIARVEGRAQ